MAAYVFVHVAIQDQEQYHNYTRLTPASIARYQGRFVARGGKAERLEGTGDVRRVVILEFPTYELARAWWASPEYEPLKAIRQASAETDMILVEGVPSL